MKKRDGLIVIAVVAVVTLSAFYITKTSTKFKVVYPKENPVIHEIDFSVEVAGGSLTVGKSNFDEAKELLPRGKDLGMSTIYKSEEPECILTFNKDKTILKKLHLLSPELATARGIKVGDLFSKVTAAYSKNYIYTGKAINAADFEAIYQKDKHRSIVFQVQQNVVKTIVLHEDILSDAK